MNCMSKSTVWLRAGAAAMLAVCALLLPAQHAFAQAGVTTASVQGTVKDAQGAVVPGASVVARHEPSGSTYEAVTQADGRFFLPGLRVGGPYTITASLPGFTAEVLKDIMLALGVTADASFTLKVAALSETVEVVGKTDPVFSSGRTGAATAVLREELEVLPTVTGRLVDMTRGRHPLALLVRNRPGFRATGTAHRRGPRFACTQARLSPAPAQPGRSG